MSRVARERDRVPRVAPGLGSGLGGPGFRISGLGAGLGTCTSKKTGSGYGNGFGLPKWFPCPGLIDAFKVRGQLICEKALGKMLFSPQGCQYDDFLEQHCGVMSRGSIRGVSEEDMDSAHAIKLAHLPSTKHH